MTGCSEQFTVVWQSEGTHVVGVIGTLTFFFVPEKLDVIAMLKITGTFDGKQTPVSFGWVDVAGYGKTTDFQEGRGTKVYIHERVSPNSFIEKLIVDGGRDVAKTTSWFTWHITDVGDGRWTRIDSYGFTRRYIRSREEKRSYDLNVGTDPNSERFASCE
jgi:hypothetical protein